jgi:hypothetical protein
MAEVNFEKTFLRIVRKAFPRKDGFEIIYERVDETTGPREVIILEVGSQNPSIVIEGQLLPIWGPQGFADVVIKIKRTSKFLPQRCENFREEYHKSTAKEAEIDSSVGLAGSIGGLFNNLFRRKKAA